MPPLAKGNAPASTLIDVIGQVIDAFDAVGDATLIKVGARHLEQWGTGHGPRVVFVPDPPGGGSIAKAQIHGNAASQIHACDVYVRADEETTDDLERLKLAYALQDAVIDFIATAASGRVAWGACSDDSPLRTPSGLGAGLSFSFTYQRDISHDARRWRSRPRNAAGAILESPLTSPPDTTVATLPTSPGATEGNVDAASPTALTTLSITVTE